MGVVIETVVWEPKPLLHIFLFCSSFFCVFLLPCMSTISNRTSTYLDLDSFSTSIPASFLRFQRSFLLVYSLASVMEGLESIYGEFEYAYYGLSKEHMVVSLCAGSVASLLIGTSLGILSDIIGQRKVCVLFCFLHLVVGFWKSVSRHPSVWMASICLSLASSIFSFGFETWMVVEHDKLGYRKDLLNDTFWLMAFYESASLIGSQALANWLIGGNLKRSVTFPSTAIVFLSTMSIIYIIRQWKESPPLTAIEGYKASISACFRGDKRVWFLAWAQACLQFSVAVFWILWAPTIVADGREVNLGMIYPCLLGARMLGSTTVPWFFSGPSPVRTEDCLLFAFLTSGFVLSIVAYDYQDIGFLVTLFCLFHACVGLILPSLARLRTMYIPNELRGGMISLSAAPASAVVLLVLIQKGYYQNIGNAVVMAFAAFGLFTAAGCMHLLKRWGKQPHHDVHKL
ncbi:PREDICTED: molybdate-anion transporter-like isoform X2 [Nelumbo nucifera]|nr:PREDICTED: molybdate-anion transporter-like isoform X2 [Nelumbo nucifera]